MVITGLGRTHNLVNPSKPGEMAAQEPATSTDEDLLRECAQGNNAALQELVRRYQPSLTRLLSQLLSSREDVEDALLNVFTKAWQSAPRFQYRARVRTWLYRIAVNLAHDLEEQRRRRPQQVSGEEIETFGAQGNAEEEALRRLRNEEQSRTLKQALERLNPTDRLLLVLYYYEEMDYEQIQGVTQLSYIVLKTRLSRARRRLRQLLEEGDRKADL